MEEPLLGRLLAGQVRGEEFDGDLALQERVTGRVDDPPCRPWPSLARIAYGPSEKPGVSVMRKPDHSPEPRARGYTFRILLVSLLDV